MRIEDECGKRVREIRKLLTMNQKEFASKVSISPTSLSDIERGKFKPGFEFLVNLVRIFNVNLYYVLFAEGDMFIDPAIASFHNKRRYAVDIEDVRNFFYYFERSSIFQYDVMKYFKTKLFKEKKTYQEEIEASQKKKKLNL